MRQNLDFFAGVYGLSGTKGAGHRRARSPRSTRPVPRQCRGLPLGFKQRLALSCAILHDPPVLFLDEPTSGVDPLTRREFWGFINAMTGAA